MTQPRQRKAYARQGGASEHGRGWAIGQPRPRPKAPPHLQQGPARATGGRLASQGSYPIFLNIRQAQNALQLSAYGLTKAQAGRRARFLILRLGKAERQELA